jgi:hypothetical protein
MERIKYIIILFFVVTGGCSTVNSFKQTECNRTLNGSLSINFKNEKASRNVFINLPEKLLIFQGTTYSDLKWSHQIKNGESFTVTKSGLFKAYFENGKVFEFGVVTQECEATIANYLGEFYQYI